MPIRLSITAPEIGELFVNVSIIVMLIKNADVQTIFS